MAGKSKILIIGGTGYIGKFMVEASAKEGHPTFALVREAAISDPVKGKIIDNFKNLGVQLLHGDLYDHESLVKAIKQVDVVISAVGHMQLGDQVKIIAAIKEAGNVKRFFPSEFGTDVDRHHAVEPAKSAFATKAQIRRTIEAEGIPYTYVAANCFAGYFLPNLSQAGATTPPRDKAVILGDGNAKAVFNYEGDIGTYTIKAVDDPRTLNKILFIKPPKNTYSFNELVAVWEKLIGKTLDKTYVPEDQLLKQIQGHSDVLHGCTIEDEAFVDMGATLLDGVVVEKHAMVAAGALVRQNTRIPVIFIPCILLYDNVSNIFDELLDLPVHQTCIINQKTWCGERIQRNLTDEEVAFIYLARLHAAAEKAKPFFEIEFEKVLHKKFVRRDEEYCKFPWAVGQLHYCAVGGAATSTWTWSTLKANKASGLK
ncbi:hypothetical protein V6N13_139053 [Hibiscus sabdariffa]